MSRKQRGVAHGVLLAMVLDEPLACLGAAQAGEFFLALQPGADFVRVGMGLDGDGADMLLVSCLPCVPSFNDGPL